MASPQPTPAPQVPVVRTVVEVRDAVRTLRASDRAIALVPTMGALHEGHLSLLRLAGADGDAVVMSLFVNPAQFNSGEDLARYPRDEARDLALARCAGADVVFAPSAAEMYPPGHATRLVPEGAALGLEGDGRPGHFAGVATVVAKLLLAVRPDRMVLGQKDAQQVAVVRRLLADLHLDDVELVVGPLVREADGLAMSSRNVRLGPEDRAAATALHRALQAARALAAGGERDGGRLEAAALAVMRAEPRCAPEYAACVRPDDFARAARLDGPALLAVAARVGLVRLIDNIALP
jgi:pantoate--beta-alanine ligase